MQTYKNSSVLMCTVVKIAYHCAQQYAIWGLCGTSLCTVVGPNDHRAQGAQKKDASCTGARAYRGGF